MANLFKKSGGTSLHIVISEAKDANTKKVIEALPNTTFFPADRAAHDIDLLVAKYVKRHVKDVTQTTRSETLTYSQSTPSFISKDVGPTTTITSETTVTESQAKNASPFQPVADHAQKMLLLNDAVDSQAAVVISNFGAKGEVKGYLFAVDPKRQKLLCQLRSTSTETKVFREQSEVSKRIAMSLSLKQSRVFFVSTNFSWLKDSTLEVAIPSLVYFVQRRKDFRLLCYPQSHQKLFVQDGAFKGTFGIYDLSQGGVSILASETEAKKLAQLGAGHFAQLLIDGLTLEIGKLGLRQHLPFGTQETPNQIKLGFSFESIAESLKRRIGSYVDRKGRAYFMDYMVASEKNAAKRGE